MTEVGLFWLTCAGFVISGAAATGSRVLQEFSRHELEMYCRRRRRLERFSEILAAHDRIALGAETLQLTATAVWLISGWFWWFGAAPTLNPGLFGRGVLVAVLALLAVTSWGPWAVAQVWSGPFLYHTWSLWKLIHFLMLPVSSGARLVATILARLAGRPAELEDEEEAFEDEIRTIVNAGLREGLLEADASEMIEGVIELGDVDVFDIMTPRSEVDAMSIDLSWPEVLRMVIEVGRTRIPVYEKTLDHIIGVLYVKDLLPELAKEEKQRRPLRRLLRRAWFVPGTRRVDDLLQDFLRTRNHMAIVLDEYRSVAGVVTIEDALEEIVGEIIDESDKEAVEELQVMENGVSEALGRTHLYQLNEELGLDFPEPDEYDTVGGFVVSQLGRIPQSGESIIYNGLRITVTEATKRRVERVRIEPVEQEEHQRETA